MANCLAGSERLPLLSWNRLLAVSPLPNSWAHPIQPLDGGCAIVSQFDTPKPCRSVYPTHFGNSSLDASVGAINTSNCKSLRASVDFTDAGKCTVGVGDVPARKGQHRLRGWNHRFRCVKNPRYFDTDDLPSISADEAVSDTDSVTEEMLLDSFKPSVLTTLCCLRRSAVVSYRMVLSRLTFSAWTDSHALRCN